MLRLTRSASLQVDLIRNSLAYCGCAVILYPPYRICSRTLYVDYDLQSSSASSTYLRLYEAVLAPASPSRIIHTKLKKARSRLERARGASNESYIERHSLNFFPPCALALLPPSPPRSSSPPPSLDYTFAIARASLYSDNITVRPSLHSSSSKSFDSSPHHGCPATSTSTHPTPQVGVLFVNRPSAFGAQCVLKSQQVRLTKS